MRPLLPLLLCFVLPALAAPKPQFVYRDETVVSNNVKRVLQALEPMQTKLQQRPRYFTTAQEVDNYYHQVWTLGNNVVTALRIGAENIRLSRVPVDTLETLSLVVSATSMDSMSNNVVNIIVDSRREVEQAGRRWEMLDMLQRAQSSTDIFVDSIVNRLSYVSQLAAWPVKNRFTSNLDRAVKVYRT